MRIKSKKGKIVIVDKGDLVTSLVSFKKDGVSVKKNEEGKIIFNDGVILSIDWGGQDRITDHSQDRRINFIPFLQKK